MTDPIAAVTDDSDSVYRFAAGRPMFRHHRSDAGYFRRGTRMVSGRPSRWLMRPGYQRQAVRLGVPAAGAGAAYAYAVQPVYTTAAAATLAAVGGVQLARKARRAWRMRRFNRTYTRPTVTALRHALGGAEVELHIDPALGGLTARLSKPMSDGEREWRARYAKHVEPLVRWAPDRAWRAWSQAKQRVDVRFGVTPRLERW